MDHFWYFWVVVVIQNLIVRLPINQAADWGWLSWAGGLQTVKLGNCNHPLLPTTTHPIYYNIQQGKCVTFCTFMIGSIIKLFDLEKMLHGVEIFQILHLNWISNLGSLNIFTDALMRARLRASFNNHFCHKKQCLIMNNF